MKINPYIAGNPVGGGEAFIGRTDVLREVLRVLRSPSENALVLYGQRRIGKTSVLQELVARLPDQGPYHPIYFDLQDKAAKPLSEVLVELAASIAHELGLPSPESWGEATPHIFREEFIPTALADLPTETSLVLLFDEFDVLDNPGEAQAGAAFFPYLRNLLSLDPRLQFIFVIGRRPEDLSSLTLSIFKSAKSHSVSLMSSEETANLVRLAERNNTLHWSDEAVAQVYALTGGHPFLTQQLCQEIWEQAYQDEPKELLTVSPAEVEAAAPAALRSATSALEWLWDGLKPAQRVVASTLAGAGPVPISQQELERRLLEGGVRILIDELQDAPRVLQEWDLIEPVEEAYHFKVELLRRWLDERKPLRLVQKEIDQILPVAENLFQAACGLYQGGSLQPAVELLRQAIGLNPNHLRANQVLAELLLAQGEVVEARKLLESLYSYHPAAARPRLVQTILRQAQDAKKDEERLALYERVLQLDPNQPEAINGRHSIWQKWGDEALAADDLEAALDAYRRIGLSEKVQQVETELRRRRWEARRQEVARLDKEEKYQTALDLARQLYSDYPEEQDNLPDLDLLERKTRLDDLYQRALGALADDRATAQKLLIEVIQLEPSYREATRYLHLVVTGVDVAEVQTQLERVKKAQQAAKTKAQSEIKAYEEQIKSLQTQLDTEKKTRQQAEAKAQSEIKAREEQIKSLQKQLDTEKKTRQQAEVIEAEVTADKETETPLQIDEETRKRWEIPLEQFLQKRPVAEVTRRHWETLLTTDKETETPLPIDEETKKPLRTLLQDMLSREIGNKIEGNIEGNMEKEEEIIASPGPSAVIFSRSTLLKGERVTATARSFVGDLTYVVIPDGTKAWIPSNSVRWEDDVTTLPIFSIVGISISSVTVRAEPNDISRIMPVPRPKPYVPRFPQTEPGILPFGKEEPKLRLLGTEPSIHIPRDKEKLSVFAVARDWGAKWVFVYLLDGRNGWVRSDSVEWKGDITELPVSG